MKLWPVAFLAFFLTWGGVQHARAGDLTRLVTSLCDYAKSNNRSAIRKKIRQSKLQLKRVYGGITCGGSEGFSGGSLLRVATYFGAFNAAKYITLQLGRGGINTPEADGKTILAWTQALAASGGGKAGAGISKFVDFYKSKSG